jgi:hypothetical protein
MKTPDWRIDANIFWIASRAQVENSKNYAETNHRRHWVDSLHVIVDARVIIYLLVNIKIKIPIGKNFTLFRIAKHATPVKERLDYRQIIDPGFNILPMAPTNACRHPCPLPQISNPIGNSQRTPVFCRNLKIPILARRVAPLSGSHRIA